MPPKDSQAGTFTAETVAVLCSALLGQSKGISNAQYELMSALDGKRSACSFQHQFRSVLRRAKELSAATQKGDELPSPVQSKPKKASAKQESVPKKQAGKKRSLETANEEDQASADEGAHKKVKLEPGMEADLGSDC